ncbi:unnamed protein product [Rhodiola kirilowii]
MKSTWQDPREEEELQKPPVPSHGGGSRRSWQGKEEKPPVTKEESRRFDLEISAFIADLDLGMTRNIFSAIIMVHQRHIVDLDPAEPVKPKKKGSERSQEELHASVSRASRKQMINQLEEELAETNERMVLLMAKKKKITKLLVGLRYPEEEDEGGSDADEVREDLRYNRNLLDHGKEGLDFEAACNSTRALAKHFNKPRFRFTISEWEGGQKWEAPLKPYIKLNSDGAWEMGSKAAGFSVVSRDEEGPIIGAIAGSVPHLKSALEAEGVAVLKAMNLAQQEGRTHCIFEIDNTEVFSILSLRNKPTMALRKWLATKIGVGLVHTVYLDCQLSLTTMLRTIIKIGALRRPFTQNQSTISNYEKEFEFRAPAERVDCVVIGAGVVGIAVARELASKLKREIIVIDSSPTFGTATSSRNSEVIHAGIYYPQNSLKATLCVRGRELMYKYCEEHAVPHKRIGKLIVASKASDVPKLMDLMERGRRNGVEDLRMLEAVEAMWLEPELLCAKALLSPVSGIVDSHSLMLSLVGDAERNGATFAYNTVVTSGRVEGEKVHINVSSSKAVESWDGESPLCPDLILVPNLIVNSAGLSAPVVAKRLKGLTKETFPCHYYARGCYFTLSNTKSPPFSHLIYPIPEDGGLGVHVTLDMNGHVKFGPDVEWIDPVDDVSSFLNRFDYSVRADRAEKFYPEVRKYYPNLMDGSLEPGYSGIRPKLSGPNKTPTDFLIQGGDVHGVPGLLNLFGIESPGLTSSLAIAEYIAARLAKH